MQKMSCEAKTECYKDVQFTKQPRLNDVSNIILYRNISGALTHIVGTKKNETKRKNYQKRQQQQRQ